MPSIPLDKLLHLSLDASSVLRTNPMNSDPNGSFDDHLQRITSQSANSYRTSGPYLMPPREEKPTQPTNTSSSSEKQSQDDKKSQDQQEATASASPNAATPSADSQTSSANSAEHPDGKPTESDPIAAAKNLKQNPNTTPAATKPRQPSSDQSLPVGQANLDAANAAQPGEAVANGQVKPATEDKKASPTNPQPNVIPEQSVAAGPQKTDAHQPQSPITPENQAATIASKAEAAVKEEAQTVSEPQKPVTAQTQVTTAAQAEAASQKQEASQANHQTELQAQAQATISTDPAANSQPAKSVDSKEKNSLVDIKATKATTTLATEVTQPQVAQAAKPEQPQAVPAESQQTLEVKPARETSGGGKKSGANSKYNSVDSTPLEASTSEMIAKANSTPDSATVVNVAGSESKGSTIDAVLTPAEDTRQPPSPSTTSQITSVQTSPTAKDSTQSSPAGTAATSSNGTTNISEVDRARFVQRVSRAMQTAGDGNGTLRLRLSPAELGNVRLEVTIRNGVMSARMEAETPAAKAALLDNYQHLESRLAEQNIKLEHFEVNLSDGSDAPGTPNQSFDNAGSQGDPGSPTPRGRTQATTNVSEPATATPASRILDSTQLNVVI